MEENNLNNVDTFVSDENAYPLSEQAADLENKIKSLEDKIKLMEEQLRRSMADYQNLLRRTQNERDQLRKYAAEYALSALIPSLDNFYFALRSLDEKSPQEQVVSSLGMIWNNLLSSLDSIGFKLIDTAGEQYDPQKFEAVNTVKTDECEDGTVLEIFRPGYMLNGKVLKAAQVSVSSTNGEG
jgi:molecular chaperone GrpE